MRLVEEAGDFSFTAVDVSFALLTPLSTASPTVPTATAEPCAALPSGARVERLDRLIGVGAELDGDLADRGHLAAELALPGAAQLGKVLLAARGGNGAHVGEEGGDVLDVVDGEAERLVSLEEAVEDLGADGADPRAGAARREL